MFIQFPEVHVKVQGLDEVQLPQMVTIRQRYDAAKIDDVESALRTQLDALPDHASYAGKRIAITVGSRGIPHLPEMVRVMADTLRAWGAEPFVVPAMGSHGGATAEGQLEMLAGYGVTEVAIGCPIVSSMDVVSFGELSGEPLYCDKAAYESDGIVVFNKVKPHTDFRGPHESGLAKMMAIGIAKHKGAASLHSFGFHTFTEMVPAAAELFLERCPVAFGVGVVQNAYDDICCIETCTPENMMETDRRLLELAKERLAKFKFDACDLLIVEQIGKNFSGNGHDPNVTGRSITHSCDDVLDAKKMVVLGLTPESHHNAAGLAMADCTTRRVLNDVDWETTWANTLTTGVTSACAIPLYANTDLEAIKLCLRSCYRLDYANALVARVKNTMELHDIQVSEALYEQIRGRDDVEFVAGPAPLRFDADGFLLP
ncbi:MAG TPA: DUF362 domain-containing protein [Candidatus Aphodovivens avistercoris]|nr:DUF362 domain-containing protein [Candidatus Aphodovivens avistercoris]